jgi:methyl halide transferase
MSTNWDEHYSRGEASWDRGTPHPALAEYLATSPVTGRVLVPGCGFGNDARAIGAAGNQVVGVDISPTAVARAESLRTSPYETYAVEDLFSLPESWSGSFDMVFEHTCFCAIQPRERPAYVSAMAKALRSDGLLFAVFFLRPNVAPDHEGPPYGVDVAELDSLFSVQFDLRDEWVPSATFPNREGRELCRLLRLRAA